MKLIFYLFAFFVFLPCVWAVDGPPTDLGGPSTGYSYTEHEAVVRVMQLLSYTGSDPAIPMAEVNAIMVALGNGGILHDNIPSSSSGQTTFLTATLHAAGITADNAALLLSSGGPVPAHTGGPTIPPLFYNDPPLSQYLPTYFKKKKKKKTK
jgi:hypothetical protein